jgi:hypothetical protein
MPKAHDLTGKVFGRLTGIEFVGHSKHKNRLWKFSCICGNESIKSVCHVLSGRTQSCGCYQREKTGELRKTHGLTRKHRSYGIWKDIATRTNNPKDKAYKNYGGRGIIRESVWSSYEDFHMWWALQDLCNSPDASIERIDVNGNYGPGNCCLILRKDQGQNKRNTIKWTKDGEVATQSRLAIKLGIKYKHLNWLREKNREYEGWRVI